MSPSFDSSCESLDGVYQRASAPSQTFAALQVNDCPVDSLYPTTRYYGSKRSILPWIGRVLSDFEFRTALDVFGGTASVSRLLLGLGKHVAYNDAFLFNQDIAHAVLLPGPPFSKRALEDFLCGVIPRSDVVYRNFDGVFYTTEENRWLDGFMEGLARSDFDAQAQRILRYCLYQACLKKRPYNLFHRANLTLRTRAGVQRSFGNATTWEAPFKQHIIQAFDELSSKPVAVSAFPPLLLSQDASTVCPGYDLVYVDPPYMGEVKRRTDGYWRRYHFLEGLAGYDNWECDMVTDAAFRMLPEPEHFRAWSDPREFFGRLENLVARHRKSIVVLSYLDGTIPSRDDLEIMFRDLFPRVDVHARDHKHVLRRGNRTELLIVGRPD